MHSLGAVGGGADGVADADATFARDAGNSTGLGPRETGHGGLDAGARGLAVRRGLRGAVEALHPAAASGGQRPLAGGVGDA